MTSLDQYTDIPSDLLYPLEDFITLRTETVLLEGAYINRYGRHVNRQIVERGDNLTLGNSHPRVDRTYRGPDIIRKSLPTT